MYCTYLLIIALTSSITSFLLKEPYDAAKIGFTIEAHSTPLLSAAIFLQHLIFFSNFNFIYSAGNRVYQHKAKKTIIKQNPKYLKSIYLNKSNTPKLLKY